MPNETYEQRGRSRALDVFRASVGPTLLTISGPADSGKTVLLGDLSRFESQHDRTVISLTGRRVDSRAEIVIGGQPSPLEPAELALLPAQTASTLMVDDAQWLDEDLARTVAVLSERRDELDLRVALSHRTAALSGPLASVADDAATGATHVALGPLPEEEVHRWLHGTQHEADEVHAATAGWTGLVAHHVLSGDSGALVDARLGLLDTPARSLIEALAWGAPVGTELVADLTGLDAVGIDEALGEAALAGLLHDESMPVPAIGQQVRRLTPESARVRIAKAALDGRHREPRGVAAQLVEIGDSSDAARDLYAWVGADLTADDPSLALLWFERAGDGTRRGPAWARALLYAGRSRDALQVASRLDTPEAAEIAAAAWAHEGLEDDPASHGVQAPAAADVLDQARSTWLDGDPQGALDQLTASAHRLEITGDAALWPDTPHATGALLATQLLDWARAERFADGSSGVGGQPFAARHNLATAWVALRRGRFSEAAAALDLLGDVTLTTRDALLAAALRLGLAVRADEPEQIPGQAAEALELQRVAAVSPANLEAHCEVALGTAKWQGSDAGAALLTELEENVLRRDWPPTSRAVVARTRIMIGLVGGDPSLASGWVEPQDALFGELSLRVAEAYNGDVDADAVDALVKRLREAGLPFEAARLAGVAAVHTTDPQVARKLLRLSRDLREVRRRTVSPAEGPDLIALSPRELDVAREMLAGLTQKQIGEALFISPKTVEHHVAHIRQKLGSQSRAETLSMLRDYLEATDG